MIEYSFNSPVTRIEVDLAYWRSVSNEWLSSSNGSAVLQIKMVKGGLINLICYQKKQPYQLIEAILQHTQLILTILFMFLDFLSL